MLAPYSIPLSKAPTLYANNETSSHSTRLLRMWFRQFATVKPVFTASVPAGASTEITPVARSRQRLCIVPSGLRN